MANDKQRNSKARKEKGRTPILEQVLGGIGLMLLASCVAFLVYEGVNDGKAPGPLTATILEIIPAGESHIVTFDLHNSGSQTLSNLQVSGRLLDGEREIERATTTIDYLPGGSSQEGGFYFQRDPHLFELQITPEGYQKP